MKRKTLFVLACFLLIPSAAMASLFGIGEAVAAGADASWKIYLAKVAAEALPTIVLLTCLIGAIVCMVAAARLADKISDMILRDNKITNRELIVLGAMAPVFLGLVGFAGFLAYASATWNS